MYVCVCARARVCVYILLAAKFGRFITVFSLNPCTVFIFTPVLFIFVQAFCG